MNLACRQLTVGMALVLGVAATVQAGQPGEFDRRKAAPKRVAPVPFTEPASADAGSNAPGALPTPKPPRGDLETGVRKPFEPFRSDDSMSGVFTPPVRRQPPPVIKSKQAKLAEERRKNWAFSTPEEIYGLPTPEELMELPEFSPEGELKKPKTSLERYLDRMEKARSQNATNQAGNEPQPSWLRPDEREEKPAYETGAKHPDSAGGDSKSPPSTLNTESRSKPAFDYLKPLGDPSSTITLGASDGTFNFSGGNFPAPAVKDTARELRMQEFKQKMLDPRTSASSSWNVSAPTPLASPATVSPYSSALSGSPYAPRPLSPPAAVPSSALPASSPGYFSSSFTPAPALEPPAPRKPAPSSTFELPKRKF